MISDGCSNSSNSKSLLVSRESKSTITRVAQQACYYILYIYLSGGVAMGVMQILTVSTPGNPTTPVFNNCTTE